MTIKEFRQLDEMEKARCRVDWIIAAACIVPSLAMIAGLLLTA